MTYFKFARYDMPQAGIEHHESCQVRTAVRLKTEIGCLKPSLPGFTINSPGFDISEVGGDEGVRCHKCRNTVRSSKGRYVACLMKASNFKKR